VERWSSQKPGIPQDEFIDDIPFPETQTYVKRILGTAEDYRYLYGGGLLDPNARPALVAYSTTPVVATAPATPAKKAAVQTKKKAAPVKKPAPRKPASRTRR